MHVFAQHGRLAQRNEREHQCGVAGANAAAAGCGGGAMGVVAAKVGTAVKVSAVKVSAVKVSAVWAAGAESRRRWAVYKARGTPVVCWTLSCLMDCQRAHHVPAVAERVSTGVSGGQHWRNATG